MNIEDMNLYQLKTDLIRSTKRGYPIFISGALYWLIMGILEFYLSMKWLSLVYILAMGGIFPIGILLGKLLKADLVASQNPLGVICGLVGGIQMFFLPAYILIYQVHPEWIPFIIGMLSGSHFFPYSWIYNSKAYSFHTFAMVGISIIFGFMFRDSAFTVFPFLMSFLYLITTALLQIENKKDV